MKKIILMVMVMTAAVFIQPFLQVGTTDVHARAPANKKFQKAEPFAGWNKLDVHAKQLWRENADKSTYWLNVIIQTDEPVKKAQKKQLKSAGFKYRSVVPVAVEESKVPAKQHQPEAGPPSEEAGRQGLKFKGSIVTGKLPIGSLKDLAGIEFVRYIEAAKVVSPKGPDTKTLSGKGAK